MGVQKSVYVFILSPPFTGSTVLENVIGSSPNVSQLPSEGQFVGEAETVMRGRHWDPNYEVPWNDVRGEWEKRWNLEKPLLLEKSPPNVLRAPAIERTFEPVYFVAMIGDPYAFCEGCRRRNNEYDLRGSAELWLRCAYHQRRNVQELENVIWFTYEEFTERTDTILGDVQEFVPGLEDLSQTVSGTFSVLGRNESEIRNINRVKKRRLSRQSYEAINDVLSEHEEILHHFGYSILRPGPTHALNRYRMRFATVLVRAARRMEDQRVLSSETVQAIERTLVG